MTKKARFIKNNELLTIAQKEEMISFFNTHPNYENLIDWNKKKINYKDFIKIKKTAECSKKYLKKNPQKLFNKKYFKIISQTDKFLIILPLSRKAFIFFNSFQCGGEGAVWCVGDKYFADDWKYYLSGNNRIFYFIYFLEKNIFFGKKMLVEYNVYKNEIELWLQDGCPYNFTYFKYFLRNHYNICKEDPEDKQLFLEFDNVVIDTNKVTENSFLLQLVKKAYEGWDEECEIRRKNERWREYGWRRY